MPTAADCCSYARECEAWAARPYDEQDCKIFLEMAKAWVELALKEQSAYRTTSPAKPGREDRQPAAAYAPQAARNPTTWIRKLRLAGCWAGSRAAARSMEESPVSPASRRPAYQIHQASSR
jgi:hypothetical protein